MSGLTSQLNKLGLGSKAATVSSSSSSSSTTASNTSSSTSTSTSTSAAPVQSSLTAALANRPRHKKSISGGNPEHGFDLGRLQPMPTAPGSTGSQTRTLQASKRQQSSTNSNSKPILISSKSSGGRGKTGREGGPTLAQSAPTVHYVPPPAPSARPRIASFDPPPMALPPSPDTRGPLANVLRQSISKGPSSRAHKKNDAAAAQARQQRSLSMYPSSAPAHNINYMEQLAAAAAVGVFPSGSGLAGKQVFEEGEEGEEEEDTPSARQRRQQRQAEDHSETSSTTSSHRSEHKSGDEKSEQQPDEISVDSGGAEEPFDSEDSDVEYSVDGEEEVIIRPIERRMSDLSSSLTYSNMMNQADVGMLSKSPTIFSILKQDGPPAGSVLGMLSSSASSTGSSHLTGTAARVGLPPLAGKKSVTSASSSSSSSSTRGIQIASGGKKPKHPGAYMGSPTDDLQFSISLDPNEDSILDQELEEEESTTPAEPIRENEFMNY